MAKTCCCGCLDLKKGAMGCGMYGIIAGIIWTGIYAYDAKTTEDGKVYTTFHLGIQSSVFGYKQVVASTAISAIWVVFSIVLLLGVVLGRLRFLWPWIVFIFLRCLFWGLVTIWYIVRLANVVATTDILNVYATIFLAETFLLPLCIDVYTLACVSAYHREVMYTEKSLTESDYEDL
ncbi:uncharacterized protein LOC106156878 [Lingula anatina]|uniref:Uncharacterized protein LOC106156878 n=1 Tax=Lingula anatina TaxID=7574 RepID=A0A1S3HQE5_LINAN|nr:uncharacterized protein LOC106156878 [Lingula anatina]|eukprot:XP_013387761.1 uncharacterized protein LOC106156878 [Lingula anatina]